MSPPRDGSRGRAFPVFLPVSFLFSGCCPDGTPHTPASQYASYCAVNTSMKKPLKNPLKKDCNVTNRPLIYGFGNLHFLHPGLPRGRGRVVVGVGGRQRKSRLWLSVPAWKPRILAFSYSRYIVLTAATEVIHKRAGRGEKRAWCRWEREGVASLGT